VTSYLESCNRALQELCQTDSRVYVLGEDILDPYGGAFKVTRGLSQKFPERVLTTPISEAGIVGVAGGMALRGLRPIVEIMFGDFTTLIADQLINYIAKYGTMYGDPIPISLVVRTPMGGGRGYGPTHSQSLEKLFLGVPSLKVVAPSRLHDPGELLKAAIQGPEPVLFIEHKLLYPTTLLTPGKTNPPLQLEWHGSEAFPTALLRNYGAGAPDICLVTYGGGTRKLDALLTALADEEISILAVVPSLINRLDARLLGSAAGQARAGTIVWEEGTGGFDWGAEVVATLHGLGRPLQPVRRVAAAPSVIPAARHLEDEVLPGLERVEQEIVDLTGQAVARA
jgi:pyruvate/2-oxoglutarate/acetoin dehydrogenase E1 component